MRIRLWSRFRRLTFWNKLAVVGTLLSFLGVIPTLIWYWDRWIVATHVSIPTDEIDKLAEALVARTLSQTQQRLRENEIELRSLRSALQSLRDGTEPTYQRAISRLKDGDTKLAEELLLQVAKTEVRLGVQANKNAAKAYRNLGAIAWLRDINKATEAYKRSTELDPDNVEGWVRLGQLLSQLSRLDDADIALGEAAKRARVNSDTLLGEAYRALADLSIARGDLERARSFAVLSIETEKAAKNGEGTGESMRTMGRIFLAERNFKRAHDQFCESLQHAGRIKDKLGEAYALRSLGEVYEIEGKHVDAIQLYNSSLGGFAAAKDSCGVATSFSQLGNIYSNKGEIKSAERMYTRGLKIYERIEWKDRIAEHRDALGMLARKDLRFDEACAHWRIARGLFVELGKIEKARDVAVWMLATACHAR